MNMPNEKILLYLNNSQRFSGNSFPLEDHIRLLDIPESLWYYSRRQLGTQLPSIINFGKTSCLLRDILHLGSFFTFQFSPGWSNEAVGYPGTHLILVPTATGNMTSLRHYFRDDHEIWLLAAAYTTSPHQGSQNLIFCSLSSLENFTQWYDTC